VDRYDPSASPDPDEWLELDEQERSLLVDDYHRRARVELPNATLHATIHVVVENQLATADEPVARALSRLMKDGLTRHDAIHAIGSVVAENIFDLLKAKDSAEVARARYYAAVERLTAAKWLASHDGSVVSQRFLRNGS
jgi:hypothetical protein